MQKILYSAFALALLGVGHQATAGFVSVNSSITFHEGDNGDATGDVFTVTNDSDSGVQISSISVNLPTDLLFDTAIGGAGTNPGSDFQAIDIPGGGYSPTDYGTRFDGSRNLDIHFTSFAPGDIFRFSIDVDNTVGATDSQKMEVPGSLFAGTTFDVTFNRPDFPAPQSFSSSFVEIGTFYASSSVSGQADPISTPEPASVLLFGMGMAGVLVALRKRTTAAEIN